MANLSVLPNEILSIVSGHLDRPRDILNLSLSSKRLHEYAKLDGWKAFLKGRFGLPGLDSDARNALHGITTLYRNWDRKAFVARFTEPPVSITSLNSWEYKRWRGPQGQTMGYQPSIDSYEEIYGSWANRREVLAWSAGTHIVMRVKETGLEAMMAWEDFHSQEVDSEQPYPFDEYRHLASWYSYKLPDSFEGQDDITSLKLFKPHQRYGDFDTIATGTASGGLSVLSVDPAQRALSEISYTTSRRPISSITIGPDASPLMAATLSDSILALYPTNVDDSVGETVDALSLVSPVASGARNGRVWSSSFLSSDKVAIGIGPSYEPIQVFEVTPTGFSEQPLRKFNLNSKSWTGTRNGVEMSGHTSVYPIIPIPSGSGSEAGNLFLSGGYDGIMRLHDMRSPHGFETLFWDVTNDSSIYSLATQGLERVVAGTSKHSMLKVFDLRFSGSHAYHVVPPSPRSNRQRSRFLDDSQSTSPITGGWNLFLSPRNTPRHKHPHPHSTRPPRTNDSPIYSLSIPSPNSPTLYAGLEGAIMSLDFLSVTDTHPDPLYSQIIERFPRSHSGKEEGNVDVKRSYDPNDDVLNLGMYEQGDEKGVGMRLMVQESIGTNIVEHARERKRDAGKFAGLDERWKDPSEDKDRWSRGQVPPPQQQQGRRGGRGRGRRRGG
ncbi:hypothetical protein BDV96DRAFT_573904 [Lophiotrema nucula]|uniref:F-box domain-containing protein n=1 Tax=Lophiotrema nucula TaxID=690887 RepID=A0A6A5ZD44_9PLEO|nr:hypothetical protein BDV96DRAFT_573904 [Lophiotrema nucula]